MRMACRCHVKPGLGQRIHQFDGLGIGPIGAFSAGMQERDTAAGALRLERSDCRLATLDRCWFESALISCGAFPNCESCAPNADSGPFTDVEYTDFGGIIDTAIGPQRQDARGVQGCPRGGNTWGTVVIGMIVRKADDFAFKRVQVVE